MRPRGSPSQSATDFAHGRSTIVAQLRAKLPRTKVLLLGTFPKDNAPTTPDRRKIQEINPLFTKLDGGKHVRFGDVTRKFLIEDGMRLSEISPDGGRLSPAGYAIWAEALRPLLGIVGAKE